MITALVLRETRNRINPSNRHRETVTACGHLTAYRYAGHPPPAQIPSAVVLGRIGSMERVIGTNRAFVTVQMERAVEDNSTTDRPGTTTANLFERGTAMFSVWMIVLAVLVLYLLSSNITRLARSEGGPH